LRLALQRRPSGKERPVSKLLQAFL
jgi:hypothetical protein